jgi:ribosomal protein S19
MGRSLKKGQFYPLAVLRLLPKFKTANPVDPKPITFWSKAFPVNFELLGFPLQVYNGKAFFRLILPEAVRGRVLGEFLLTRAIYSPKTKKGKSKKFAKNAKKTAPNQKTIGKVLQKPKLKKMQTKR